MAYLGIPPFGSRTSRIVTEVTATSGQTTFYPTGGYVPGYIDVFHNGVQLNTSEYVATDSTSVVLSVAAIAGDELRLIGYNLALEPTGAYTRTSFTATSNQTTFSAQYSIGFVEVYLNGVLLNTTDYTATNGTSVVLATGVPSGTLIDIIAYSKQSVGTVAWNGVTGTPTTLSGYGITDGFTLPNQTGNSGKYLTTNGTAPSWAAVEALPSQTGNSGKVLTTNGTTASWQAPSMTVGKAIAMAMIFGA